MHTHNVQSPLENNNNNKRQSDLTHAHRKGALFVGDLSTNVDSDAVVYFTGHILPYLRNRLSHFSFVVLHVGNPEQLPLQLIRLNSTSDSFMLQSMTREEWFGDRVMKRIQMQKDMYQRVRISVFPFRSQSVGGLYTRDSIIAETEIASSMRFGVPIVATSIASQHMLSQK